MHSRLLRLRLLLLLRRRGACREALALQRTQPSSLRLPIDHLEVFLQINPYRHQMVEPAVGARCTNVELQLVLPI